MMMISKRLFSVGALSALLMLCLASSGRSTASAAVVGTEKVDALDGPTLGKIEGLFGKFDNLDEIMKGDVAVDEDEDFGGIIGEDDDEDMEIDMDNEDLDMLLPGGDDEEDDDVDEQSNVMDADEDGYDRKYDRRYRYRKNRKICLRTKGLWDVNVFTSGDFYARKSDVEGRVLVGRDADISNYSIGKGRFFGLQLSCPQIRRLFKNRDLDLYEKFWANEKGEYVTDALTESIQSRIGETPAGEDEEVQGRKDYRPKLSEKEFSLIVNKKLSISDSRIFNGGVAYGSEDSQINIQPSDVGDKCIIARIKNLFNFARLRRGLKLFSFLLAKQRTTSAYSFDGTTLVLRFNGKVKVEVFRIPGWVLLRARVITTQGFVRRSTPIVINVDGKISGFLDVNMDSLRVFETRLVWNFYNAKLLFFSGVAIRGTVLAPYATIFNANGIIWGQVWTKNWGTRRYPGTMQVQNIPLLIKICIKHARRDYRGDN